MKLINFSSAIAAAAALSFAVAGCSHDPDIVDQAKAAKGKPPPSAAQLKKGFDEIAANHDKSKQEERAWAAAHPDKVAQVNADRAAAGKPPLGQ